MRVLFDPATPVPIRPYLKNHNVRTAAQEGWDTLQNGELLAAAEAAGFDLLLTTDKNMRYQQNLADRKIALVVLGQQRWPDLRPHIQLVVDAVDAATPGAYWKLISRENRNYSCAGKATTSLSPSPGSVR